MVLDGKSKSILEFMPDGVVLVDAEGLIVYTNSEADGMFGYSSGELIGQPIEVLVPEAVRTGHVEKRRSYMRNPSKRSMGALANLLGRRKDGSEFSIDISLAPIPLEKKMFALAVVRDRTQRSEMEKQLRREKEKAEALNKMMTGRELRMVELKKEINELLQQIGRPPRYEV